MRYYTPPPPPIGTQTIKPRDRLSKKHAFQLIPNSAKDGIRGIEKTTDKWNDIPGNVVNAKNINSLKNVLDEYFIACQLGNLIY